MRNQPALSAPHLLFSRFIRTLVLWKRCLLAFPTSRDCRFVVIPIGFRCHSSPARVGLAKTLPCQFSSEELGEREVEVYEENSYNLRSIHLCKPAQAFTARFGVVVPPRQ